MAVQCNAAQLNAFQNDCLPVGPSIGFRSGLWLLGLVGGIIFSPPVVQPPFVPFEHGPSAGKRFPKRRRATIERHYQVLRKAPRESLAKEIQKARQNLAELDALNYLLDAQDQLLLEMYRKLYLEYLLKQDDETIIMLAG